MIGREQMGPASRWRRDDVSRKAERREGRRQFLFEIGAQIVGALVALALGLVAHHAIERGEEVT
jgi:hypothetical protein